MTSFLDDTLDPKVRGYLHTPQTANGHALILTHGAGGNANAPLLIALAETFASHGYTVLRCDLPFRQAKSFGPPFPAQAARDRAGLRNAVELMRKQVSGKVFLGGHSYGGRQSTMLCAEEPDLVAGLLLLSYPLHPPRKPDQLRTQHLPHLRTPCLFFHGTSDPFGSIQEIMKAAELIPAKSQFWAAEGAGHDLGFKGKLRRERLPDTVYGAFEACFFESGPMFLSQLR